MSQENNLEKSVQILDAIPEDAKSIARVMKESWLTTYPNETAGISAEDIPPRMSDGPERVAQWKADIEDQSGDKHTWAAKDGSEVVGFCIALRHKDNNEIKSIYILNEYQGLGLGYQLMTKALDWLGSEKDVTLLVTDYNENAINFYKKLGFEISEKPPTERVQMNNKSMFLLEMIKRGIPN